MRTYQAAIRSATANSTFQVKAETRGQAVYKASQAFWRKHGNTLGSMKSVLFVDDPHGEVTYKDDIDCQDRLYKLLSDELVRRVIADSRGQIIKDEKPNSPYCLKRAKRRRDFGKFIAPNIRQMASGLLYYRIVTVPQKSKNGKTVQKRGFKDVMLESKDLVSALAEIAERKLIQKSNKKASFAKPTRSIKVLKKLIEAKLAPVAEVRLARPSLPAQLARTVLLAKAQLASGKPKASKAGVPSVWSQSSNAKEWRREFEEKEAGKRPTVVSSVAHRDSDTGQAHKVGGSDLVDG